jgi:hypothetical protein
LPLNEPSETSEATHCKGCGEFLYDYEFLVEAPVGVFTRSGWCCDCYPNPSAPTETPCEVTMRPIQ